MPDITKIIEKVAEWDSRPGTAVSLSFAVDNEDETVEAIDDALSPAYHLEWSYPDWCRFVLVTVRPKQNIRLASLF